MSTTFQVDDDQSEAAKPGCKPPDRICILGIRFDNLTMSEAVQAIVDRLDHPLPSQACFVNADCVNIAHRNPQYLDVLHKASLTLADGIGLKLAGLVHGIPVRDNVNGTDLFPRLCAELPGTGIKMFLLGGRPGVAGAAANWVAQNYPGVVIAGCQHGYFKPEEETTVIQRISDSGADVLLVAFGAPQQELWINRHLHQLGVKVAIGVGGLFDFYSGRISRAPLWMRKIGVEWLYRLYQEPTRLSKRYLLGGPLFLMRVLLAYAPRRKGTP